MVVKRYELSEAQWMRIAALVSGKVGGPGRSGNDNRLFVNGFCGCCGPARSGNTSRNVTANKRPSTPASLAGPRLASGRRCSQS